MYVGMYVCGCVCMYVGMYACMCTLSLISIIIRFPMGRDSCPLELLHCQRDPKKGPLELQKKLHFSYGFWKYTYASFRYI